MYSSCMATMRKVRAFLQANPQNNAFYGLKATNFEINVIGSSVCHWAVDVY